MNDLPEIPRWVRENMLFEKKQNKEDMDLRTRMISASMLILFLLSIMSHNKGYEYLPFVFRIGGIIVFGSISFFNYYNKIKKVYTTMENLVNQNLKSKDITDEQKEKYLRIKEKYSSYFLYNKKIINISVISILLSIVIFLLCHRIFGLNMETCTIFTLPSTVTFFVSIVFLLKNTRKYLVIKSFK